MQFVREVTQVLLYVFPGLMAYFVWFAVNEISIVIPIELGLSLFAQNEEELLLYIVEKVEAYKYIFTLRCMLLYLLKGIAIKHTFVCDALFS